MRAYVVIGANYGDEGKGLITDYLCRRENADLVVRFNGGAQAGHTVVTPEGVRHVFSHFGSGTLAGVPTFLSRFFVCNPPLFVSELTRLPVKDPKVSVAEDCLVTTPWDMMLNQAVEKARGKHKHGSCGVGFGETIERSEWFQPLLVKDLLDRSALRKRLIEIEEKWVPKRSRELGVYIGAANGHMMERYLDDCRTFVERCELNKRQDAMTAAKRIVFEGAQGLLLDMDNEMAFPHVTRSNTGCLNVRMLTNENFPLDLVYVSRTYLTRHGAGHLENEAPFPGHVGLDETNIAHPFQGELRYAPMRYGSWEHLKQRVIKDSRLVTNFPAIALTWADREPPNKRDPMVQLVSYGPTSTDVLKRNVL